MQVHTGWSLPENTCRAAAGDEPAALLPVDHAVLHLVFLIFQEVVLVPLDVTVLVGFFFPAQLFFRCVKPSNFSENQKTKSAGTT